MATAGGHAGGPLVRRAEAAVHARARTSFAAATAAGVPGRFRAFATHGLHVLLVDSPGLEFLGVVTGVDESTVEGLPDVLAAGQAGGWGTPTVVTGDSPAVADRLLG